MNQGGSGRGSRLRVGDNGFEGISTCTQQVVHVVVMMGKDAVAGSDGLYDGSDRER